MNRPSDVSKRELGQLVDAGGETAITFRRSSRHPPHAVWDAIATPDGLSAWLLCTSVRIDGRVGGTIEMISGPAQYHSAGRILAWMPPRLFEYEWHLAAVPEMPDGERAIFRYELLPERDGTQPVVTYRRLARHTATGFLPGLHAFLDRLEAQLEGRPLPDWTARFAALGRQYPAWTDHEA